MRNTMRDGRRNGPSAWWLALAFATAFACAQEPGWAAFTADFRTESCTWSAWGRQNPFFSLRPGRQLVMEGEEGGAHVRAEVTVLREFEAVAFTTARGVPLSVITRVVEERDFEDGELVEVSRNFFARCTETSDIFYFGEEVDLYEGGQIVSHERAWRAGEDDALPGVMVPGSFLLGSRYFQERAPQVAEDRAEHTGMGLHVATPAGAFGDCVSIEETSGLRPGPGEVKIYCPDVGLVRDGTLSLVEAGVVP